MLQPVRCLAAALALAFPLSVAVAEAAELGPRSSASVKKAIDAKSANVALLIAAKPGRNAALALSVQRLGAVVRYREDDVDYLRVLVAPEKATAIAALPDVQAIEVSEPVAIPDPRPDGVLPVLPQPAPGPATGRDNPYMPIRDIGAAQFLAAHPTWDGRGVTIGIVDSGVTLDHPSLLTTSTGERKIVDWVTYTDAFTDDDPTWVNMSRQVSGATFVVDGITYTAPAAAAYRFGTLDERDPRLGGEVGRDLNRDGNPTGSSGVFAVLWDTTTNRVWVDVNQNHSFADEMAMRDYKVAYDVNYFGVDNPATAVAERMPFVVQTDGKNKVVNIGIVSGAHGSHVAGIA
ncbi:MAG TPA: serine protease, partial [Casimicrobiaceae bacterium]|nr:serine protease [Casimicrobiaceae bacterium]